MATLTEVRLSYYIPAMFEDSSLRVLIYDEIVRTGETPTVATLAHLVGAPLDDVRGSLRRMHDGHMVVLQPTGEILMANPFSAVPTPFIAEVEGRRWFGNCIWDGLGIIAALHPAEQNPAAPKQVQEKGDFRENICCKNGTGPALLAIGNYALTPALG